MHRLARMIAVLLCAGALVLSSGCAWSSHNALQPPGVEILSVSPMGGRGLDKQFVVTLRINNPNNTALDVSSIDCVLTIEQNPALHSVSKRFPLIEPYSEEVYNVLFIGKAGDSVKLVKYLVRHKKESVAYTVSGELALHGWFTSAVPFESTGTFIPKRH